METVRRRVPFRFVEDEDGSDNESSILDDDQQEALVSKLRAENAQTNETYTRIVQAFIILSTFLILSSPLNATAQIIPYPSFFALIGLLSNVNLFLLITPLFSNGLVPLAYPTNYMLSLVAPTLCLFVADAPWASVAWWSIPVVMVCISHIIQDAMETGSQSIEELEATKYFSPGA
ncbi:hypothetical protein DL96DRAFT_181229 [Flagelloscypha sp. PMI_526]|nr:hypothetical protein DL96DRAFT_181229 [Flagelloscypha sp. PMI_526]